MAESTARHEQYMKQALEMVSLPSRAGGRQQLSGRAGGDGALGRRDTGRVCVRERGRGYRSGDERYKQVA